MHDILHDKNGQIQIAVTTMALLHT